MATKDTTITLKVVLTDHDIFDSQLCQLRNSFLTCINKLLEEKSHLITDWDVEVDQEHGAL